MGLIFMVVRKIPTLVKLPPPTEMTPAVSFSQKLKFRLRGIKYSTYRPLILNWLEKNLRKLRLLILKIDNLFVGWIKSARHKSEIWTVRSGAWMEHMRFKKKEKAQVLEKLDKVEISQTLEKINKEVAAEEDQALKEKIGQVNGNGGRPAAQADNGNEKTAFLIQEAQPPKEAELPPQGLPSVTEENRYIDLIAQNPKDAEAYRVLGSIYLKQKNYSDARACFRQVLKIEPDDMGIKIKLNEIKGLRNKSRSNSMVE